MKFLLSLVGICSHQRTTFPLTPIQRVNSRAYLRAVNPYVVCLDCGKEFAYDWDRMKRGEEIVAYRPSCAGRESTAFQE